MNKTTTLELFHFLNEIKNENGRIAYNILQIVNQQYQSTPADIRNDGQEGISIIWPTADLSCQIKRKRISLTIKRRIIYPGDHPYTHFNYTFNHLHYAATQINNVIMFA